MTFSQFISGEFVNSHFLSSQFSQFIFSRFFTPIFYVIHFQTIGIELSLKITNRIVEKICSAFFCFRTSDFASASMSSLCSSRKDFIKFSELENLNIEVRCVLEPVVLRKNIFSVGMCFLTRLPTENSSKRNL